MDNSLVVITTIRQGSIKNPIEKTRSEVFLETSAVCAKSNIDLVAVYKDCSLDYLKKLESFNVLLFQQKTQGTIGAVRREAINVGLKVFYNAKHYLWIEPEKPSLPIIARDIIPTIDQANAEFCFFNRENMGSYPPEQAYYYLFCRAVASSLLGFDLDYAFGPMILSKKTAPFFINYRGDYGDLWDSILIPRLRIIRSNIPYMIETIKFNNDPRMTKVESGNTELILKRLEQLQNVIPSLVSEWVKK